MFIENIKEALASIFSNKMRSILTMLGIIIGISSVILITTIGNSIKQTIASTLNSLGGNSFTVMVEAKYPETEEEWNSWVYPEMDEDDYITQEMVDGLLEEYPDEFVGVVSSTRVEGNIVQESVDRYAYVTVMGETPASLRKMKLNIMYGRELTERDQKEAVNVCLISNVMARNYFAKENPLGKTITVENSEGLGYDLVVVGVYERTEALFGKENTKVPEKDRESMIIIPDSRAKKIMNDVDGVSGYDYFELMLSNTADSSVAQLHAQSYFDEFYENNRDWNIYIYNMSDDLKIIDVVINVITVAISGIAAISLIVGGVGVMNIMLVSITERTKEIGVRMALGAKRKVIRSQFVIEAIVLCIIGGIIGIILGILGGFALGGVAEMVIKNAYAQFADYIILSVRPSGVAIILSLVFSMLTGVFFGYYPANKAAKMEVIDALRYE